VDKWHASAYCSDLGRPPEIPPAQAQTIPLNTATVDTYFSLDSAALQMQLRE
jgi:hypothetical protein